MFVTYLLHGYLLDPHNVNRPVESHSGARETLSLGTITTLFRICRDRASRREETWGQLIGV